MSANQEPEQFETTRGMVRNPDYETSIEAAKSIAPRLSELHLKVINAFNSYGPMNDWDLEHLPTFENYGPSTIRKRRSELYQMGRMLPCGTKENPRGRKMILWKLAA